MNRTRSLIIGIAAGVCVGVIITLSVVAIVKYNRALVKSQQGWFVCKIVNMNIIADAVRTYKQTNLTANPVTLQTLVNAKLLPEWGEIYICPGQFRIPALRSNYDDSFVSNMFKPSGLAVNYSNGSYYVETLSNSFRLRCRYHTNVVDVTIQKNK